MLASSTNRPSVVATMLATAAILAGSEPIVLSARARHVVVAVRFVVVNRLPDEVYDYVNFGVCISRNTTVMMTMMTFVMLEGFFLQYQVA